MLPLVGEGKQGTEGVMINPENNSCILCFENRALKAGQRETRTKSEGVEQYAVRQSP